MIGLIRLRLCSVVIGFVIAATGCGTRDSVCSPLAVKLGFYIAVTVTNLPAAVDIAKQREKLGEQGAESSSHIVQWLPIANIRNWIKDTSERSAINADAVSYFESNWRLVGARKADEYYLLVHTASDKTMQYCREAPWGVENVVLSRDNVGRPSILVELDSVGANRMRELTTPHLGEPLAIVVNGRVFSAPVLQSPLGRRLLITGEFTEDEARHLRDQLVEFIPSLSRGG